MFYFSRRYVSSSIIVWTPARLHPHTHPHTLTVHTPSHPHTPSQFTQSHKSMYAVYCSNYDTAEALINKLRAKRKDFDQQLTVHTPSHTPTHTHTHTHHKYDRILSGLSKSFQLDCMGLCSFKALWLSLRDHNLSSSGSIWQILCFSESLRCTL